MVYDCFQFFNELDILKLRMHVLNDVVDKFVISEATVTFSGEKKPLYFQENREMFREFENKIIHKVVDDTPMDTSAFMRDSHQKCAVARGLEGAKDDDIVIFSDVDEIPNPEAVKKVLADFDGSKIYALAQRNFYCYLNMEETSGSLLSITGEFEGFTGKDRRWLGTKICNYGMLKRFTTEQLRDSKQKELMVRVADGGWHFSYMGGGKDESVEDRVKYKIKSAAHQEYNNRATLSKVKKKIRNHEDILGRSTDFQIVPVDESYPVYLREHLDEILLQLLEGRLDNIVFRLGIAPTRAAARQLVSHKHITVDGEVVNIPSYAVKPGQVIGVRERSKSLEVIANSLAGFNHSKYPWLEWDDNSKVGKLLHVPERADIPENIKEHLIVELYSK